MKKKGKKWTKTVGGREERKKERKKERRKNKRKKERGEQNEKRRENIICLPFLKGKEKTFDMFAPDCEVCVFTVCYKINQILTFFLN